jgi:trigger factor
VNVTIQDLAPCKKLLRVEVETQEVDKTFDSVTKEYQKQAALPGFRPGKAPREMVTRKYGKDIEDQVKRQLINDTYRKAIEEQKLEVLGQPEIEEIQFNRGEPLHYAATVETFPQFELPEYKGIPVTQEARSVTETEVQQAIEMLRAQQTGFNTVPRPLQSGDVAVVNFSGTCEGKPITEIAPTASGLTEKKNFWIEANSSNFIPGFAEQLIGAQAGEKRTVTVDFPADFVTPQLAGKKGVYEVEMVEVKEKVLPPIDDALAKAFGAESLEKLRAGVRRDLENELKHKESKNIRSQIVRALMERVNFELPDSEVAKQTKNVVYDIVQENQKRGISREMIEKEKERIFSAATQNARERVKFAFILQKIAEKEEIKIAEQEILRRIQELAAMYQIPPEKFIKDLQQRNGMIEIYDQIMNEKVFTLLQEHAKIQEVAVTPGAEANPS